MTKPLTPDAVLPTEPRALARVERIEGTDVAVAAPAPSIPRRSLMEMWLEGRSPDTVRAYLSDLKHFARFLERAGYTHVEMTSAAAAAFLTGRSHVEANELVLTYRNSMKGKKSPATVNRRLGALRSLAKLANLLGHCTWTLGVQNVKHAAYRETQGPGIEATNAMLNALKSTKNTTNGTKAATVKAHANASGGTANGASGVDSGPGRSNDAGSRPWGKTASTSAVVADIRNRAIIRLLFNHALRRGEVASLALSHVDLERGAVSILGKGRTERETVDLSASALKALRAWLEVRPAELGVSPEASLFGISGHGIWSVVKAVARRAGIDPKKVRPHGFRHTGITGALDAGVDIREAMRFSRHKNMNTLQIYDDNRKNVAKKVSDVLDRVSSTDD